MNTLPVLFGYEACNIGNSHVALSLCRHWDESGRKVTLTAPGALQDISYPWLRTAMKGFKLKMLYKFGTTAQATRLAERLFLKKQSHSSVVYLWAGLSLEIFEQFHALGSRIIIERINCHRRTAWQRLETAASEWNIPTGIVAHEQDAIIEDRKLALADSVFCPSPMVRASMLEQGVDESKLLSTSYGWAPERFPEREAPRKPGKRPVFLFAGSICLRKGIPLLLEAWKRASLDAELILCGRIDPLLQTHLPPLETIPNVRHINHTHDMGAIYRSADVFVFPSLEEGGPMVTYEAMSHSLPCLVSSMGAGAIVEHGINGTILPDMDVDAWAEAMTNMAERPALRRELGQNGRKRADSFTWQNVAAQRASLLENRYPHLWQQVS